MTAAVVVMNASAVAMAADSAVSIPYGRVNKTYTQARKLLPLHKSQPVAVMVWDAPAHFALPWEVIVADFRKHRPKALPGLDEYIEAFFSFVDAEAGRWAPADHEITLVARVLDPDVQKLQKLWRSALDAKEGPSNERAIAAAANDVAQTFVTQRRRALESERWAGCKPDQLTAFNSIIEEGYTAGATQLWGHLELATREELVKLARERLVHMAGEEPGSSGLIFAGYGASDVFAQARIWRVSGRLASQTRRVERRRLSISADTPSFVVPVAQEGVIHSFLKGLHPDVDKLVGDLVNVLAQIGGPDVDSQALATDVKQQFDQQVSKRDDEVAHAVEFLPASELAVLAGDLIRMVALRNRATLTPETVGGPIDVIVLSRTDGIRWVDPPDGFRVGQR